MRTVFIVYSLVIGLGLTYFLAVGLIHY